MVENASASCVAWQLVSHLASTAAVGRCLAEWIEDIAAAVQAFATVTPWENTVARKTLCTAVFAVTHTGSTV